MDNSVECRGNCGKITLRSLWKTHEIVDNVILISCLLNLKSALESNLALFLTFLLFDFFDHKYLYSFKHMLALLFYKKFC